MNISFKSKKKKKTGNNNIRWIGGCGFFKTKNTYSEKTLFNNRKKLERSRRVIEFRIWNLKLKREQTVKE